MLASARVASMDRQLLVNNITGAAKAAVAYGLPIIRSTVNMKTGRADI